MLSPQMKYIIIIQHIQQNIKRNLTKKYRISADCGDFIQLQVSKTRLVPLGIQEYFHISENSLGTPGIQNKVDDSTDLS